MTSHSARADERTAGLSLVDRAKSGAISLALQATVGGVALYGASQAANLPGRERRAGLFQANLMFPLDLITNANKYYMSLRFVKYTKRAISDRKVITNKGVIHLPIPNQLNDTTSLNYPTVDLGPMMGSFTEAATSGTFSGREKVNAGLEGIAAAVITTAATALPGAEQIMNAASAVSGFAINPFTTVVFKGPQFKTHNFSWKFFPKSKQESDMLTKIVQTIKYHILPGLLTSSGVIFEYPEMVNITISPSEENLYTFKPCIIKSLNVNYAPSGGPSFFRSSLAAPTGIELKIELQEIEYFTKMDIDKEANPDAPSLRLPRGLLPSFPGFAPLTPGT